ncbi:coiled-coil domain-containing protein 18-like [Gigantopelta aegis]|uniref:coiled-coil domain-containing protein 18-like n=1 Tax=Gigantopelta aegis TaxID=1735272 RepID=UPI001B887E8D|nr:coiled-coil domain-containing protein 18-like [Gigantopelta aegis]
MANAPSSSYLMKNVQDLRKRLIDTEKNLRTLTDLESAEIEGSRGLRTANSSRRLPSHDPQPATETMSYRRDNTDDFVDRESIRSGLSTLPDSYTGFLERPFPASTPNRHETYSRRYHEEDLQSDVQSGEMNSSHHRSRNHQDTSSKVMRQNHRLLSEVERLAYELQTANRKIRELTEEFDGNGDIIAELEDKIEGLQSETDAQDTALRTAEERYEECQRTVSHLQSKTEELEQDVADLRTELNAEKKLRRSVEKQRDEALQNFLESQESLSAYQKRMKDKVKMMEQSEDHLRDMLSHISHERDELGRRLAAFEDKFENQDKELQRLQSLEAVELETQNDMEQQNMEMREELRIMKAALIKLQAESDDKETVRRENARLQTENQKQQQELNVCQQEVEESRTLLVQLELLAHQLHRNSQASITGNDSGVSGMLGVHGQSSSSFNKDSSNCADEVESHSTGATKGSGARSIVSDLRLQLHSKDAEIQRLRSSLESRENDPSSAVCESLRAELSSLMDRHKHESEKSQELEVVIGQLEMDKSRLATQLMDLQRNLSDRDSQNVALDSRITQRNSQIIEFQEEINRKCTENNNLERELRKKSLRLSSVEDQLDEKMREFSTHIARMKQLEEEVIGRGEENRGLQDQLDHMHGELRNVQQAHDKLQHVHNNQCDDYCKQIDRLQEQVERKTNFLKEYEKDLISLKGELAEKSSKLDHIEQALKEAKEELKLRSQQNQSLHAQLEHLSVEGKSQMKHLESSLLMCKEEIRTCVSNLNLSRDQFNREVKQKDEQLSRLNSEFKEMRQELDEKTQENRSLEKSLLERQSMLQQSTRRISELEENQLDLNRQVSYLEQQLLRDKAQLSGQCDTAERKLRQACNDLEHKTAEVSDLNQTVRSLQEEKRRLLSDLTSAEEQLQEEREDQDNKSDRLSRLEKDVRDLRVQLEQKIELVNDLEDQVANKEEDMRQQLQLVNEMDAEVKRLKDSLKEAKQEAAKTDDDLQRALFDVKAKEDMLNDLRDALRKTQEELDSKCDELYEMQRALDDRQRELQERMSQVAQLDHTIKDTHSEMEKRMHKLDTQLQKYETEIDERTKQIANLDDSLQQTQTQLREKMLQLQQTEQLAQRQQLELQATSAKLDELEKVSERQRQKIEEQREENVEITQELRLTREQLQQLHGDFMTTRRELAQAHRERDRLTRELEETLAFTQSKDTDTARLAEEVVALQAQEAQAEARHKGELDLLKSEIDSIKEKHRNGIEHLNDSLTTLQSTNEELMSELAATLKEMEVLESRYKQQLDKARDDLEILHNELMSRKEVIDTANETIVLKEAEIARLQARLSGYERAAISQLCLAQMAQEENRGVAPGVMLQTVPHNVLHNRQNIHSSSQLPESDTRYVNGTAQMFDAEVQPSRTGSEHIFQEMLLEASKNGQPDLHPSKPSDVRKALNFDSVSESDVHLPVGVKGSSQVCNETDAHLLQDMDISCISQDTDTARVPQDTDTARVTQDTNTSRSVYVRTQRQPKRRGDFPILHDDPHTAVGIYENHSSVQSSDSGSMDKISGVNSEQSLVDLHERLRSNQLQQQEIERQLQSLNADDSTDAEVAALT